MLESIFQKKETEPNEISHLQEKLLHIKKELMRLNPEDKTNCKEDILFSKIFETETKLENKLIDRKRKITENSKKYKNIMQGTDLESKKRMRAFQAGLKSLHVDEKEIKDFISSLDLEEDDEFNKTDLTSQIFKHLNYLTFLDRLIKNKILSEEEKKMINAHMIKPDSEKDKYAIEPRIAMELENQLNFLGDFNQTNLPLKKKLAILAAAISIGSASPAFADGRDLGWTGFQVQGANETEILTDLKQTPHSEQVYDFIKKNYQQGDEVFYEPTDKFGAERITLVRTIDGRKEIFELYIKKEKKSVPLDYPAFESKQEWIQNFNSKVKNFLIRRGFSLTNSFFGKAGNEFEREYLKIWVVDKNYFEKNKNNLRIIQVSNSATGESYSLYYSPPSDIKSPHKILDVAPNDDTYLNEIKPGDPEYNSIVAIFDDL
ncbi:MAG: hypothetical protein GF347_03795 [Candidatus Moranbacteria bacterium]|nr:hypothetical protein [Candidatus Moranbacteria bacterium]